MIDLQEIKKKCPKAYEKLKDWIRDQFKNMQKLLNEGEPTFEVPELEFTDDFINGVLSWNIRQLYDFGDKHDVILNVCEDALGGFCYFIGDEEWSLPFKTRIEAETAAFMEIFNKIEKNEEI